MKKLALTLSLALASVTASADVYMTSTQYYPYLQDFGPANSSIFTVTGNSDGTKGPINLTYTFLKPMVAVEIDFFASGAPVIGASMESTASGGYSIDQLIIPDTVQYFTSSALLGDLTKVHVSISQGSWNNNTSDDMLNVFNVRGKVREHGYVPEPSVPALMGLGVCGLVLSRRRNKPRRTV